MINDPGMNALDGATGCGAQLRQAREAAGLSLDQVGAQLRMPIQVVRALEEEQWQKLGAPVFVRGQLRSYARLLKVDLGGLLAQARIAQVEPPTLVSHTHTPRLRRMAENAGRRAVYVVITAVLAVPVWYAVTGDKSADPGPSTASLDVVPAAEPLPASSVAGVAVETPRTVAAPAPSENGPYIASIAPVARTAQVDQGRGITLNFTNNSWVEVFSPDGATLERAEIPAGEKRTYKPGEVGRVLLGNASGVEVQQAGATVDLAPYKRGNRGNVARFTVSSDGSMAPVSH